MNFRLLPAADPALLAPLTCGRSLAECPVAGTTLAHALQQRWLPDGTRDDGLTLTVTDQLWPSVALAAQLRAAGPGAAVAGTDVAPPWAWISTDGQPPPGSVRPIPPDEASRTIRHPWDLLAINEELVGSLAADDIRGIIRPGVNIDGHVVVGEGTVLLPGVYIEGNVIIGRDGKIGPNCYLRGNTAIGDRCHVGQSVEIKNSLLMDRVAVGHLSYVGDSILGVGCNLGAGTITANFRHDGKSHRAMIAGRLIPTGRRKLGAILGDGVHTGIHTGIYPGRKIWPGLSTRPGEMVARDLT